MINWFIKKIEKIKNGNSKTKSNVLKKGEQQEITFPFEQQNNQEWRLKKWYFNKGEQVKEGQIICCIENDKNQIEFESFVSGRLNYFKVEGQKIEKGELIAEIIGV